MFHNPHFLKRILCLTFLAASSISCNAIPLAQKTAVPTQSSSASAPFADYKTWTPLFDAPRNVSMQLMALCRTMTEAEQSYINSEHAEFFVQVYTNPIGQAAMKQEGARTFPVGTVIVKEKFTQDTRVPNSQPEAAGLGVMVKRAAGFDNAGGDWEYLYVDRSGLTVTDQKQMQDCRACHMQARERDAVYYPTVIGE